MWIDATIWFNGSVGLYVSHEDRSPPQPFPPTSTGWVAPTKRTPLINDCIPAACHPPDVVQPSRQHVHEMSCGSL